MIYEWYTGSDTTGHVAKKIRDYSYAAEDLSADQRIAVLEDILTVEEDPNWQGYLRHYIGCQYLTAGNVTAAVSQLEGALKCFDELAANFKDVREQYSRTLFYLVKEYYILSNNRQKLFEYSMRMLPFIDDLIMERGEKFDVFALVGEAVQLMAAESNDASLYRIALDFHIKAHHLEPDDPGTLESLVYAFYALNQKGKAASIYEMFCELEVEYEHRDRLQTFCKSAF